MHDADMRVLVDSAVPPVPCFAVRGAIREGAQAFYRLPVGEADADRGCGCLGYEARGAAEDCGMVGGLVFWMWGCEGVG